MYKLKKNYIQKYGIEDEDDSKLLKIPQKTKLFLEDTQRERDQPKGMMLQLNYNI